MLFYRTTARARRRAAPKLRENLYDSVEALQADLDERLVHYNTERPHLGYRNMGRRPVETVMSFVSQEG
jgi:hypothetical protein